MITAVDTGNPFFPVEFRCNGVPVARYGLFQAKRPVGCWIDRYNYGQTVPGSKAEGPIRFAMGFGRWVWQHDRDWRQFPDTSLPNCQASGVHFRFPDNGFRLDKLVERTGSSNIGRKLPVVGGLLLAATIMLANYVTSNRH